MEYASGDLSPLTEKRCPRCKETRPLSSFRKGSKKGGVAIYCRACADAYLKRRRATARDVAVSRVNDHGKICIDCSELKTAEEFKPSTHTLDGYAQRCIACVARLAVAHAQRRRLRKQDPVQSRKKKLWRLYRMTEHDFQKLVEVQSGACAICRCPLMMSKATCVDHDHSTGEVRGLLCHPCNTAIGFLKDNPTLCRLAAEYLERTK